MENAKILKQEEKSEVDKLKENIIFRLRMLRAEYDDSGKVMASNAICKAICIVKSGGAL